MGSTEERREKAKAFVRYSCCQGGGGEKGFWNMSRGKIYDMGLLAYVRKYIHSWVSRGSRVQKGELCMPAQSPQDVRQERGGGIAQCEERGKEPRIRKYQTGKYWGDTLQ